MNNKILVSVIIEDRIFNIFNELTPEQNGWHSVDLFKCIFLNVYLDFDPIFIEMCPIGDMSKLFG